MAKTYLKRPAAQARAYSQAVVSDGGKVVWLAGQVAAEDASGNSLTGDFDGQVREVTMTVFITDARFGDRFTELRKAIFSESFPASALITVAGLARPELLVEVQGVAVIG